MTPQLGLLIDTSFGKSAVAIVDLRTQQVAASRASLQATQDGAVLGTLIAQVLEKQSCALSQVTHVLVSAGPGSFTGIKVGLAFVAGLARARKDLIVLSCSSFSLLANDLLNGQAGLVILPATRNLGAAYLISTEGTASLINLDLNQMQQIDSGTFAKKVVIVGDSPSWCGHPVMSGLEVQKMAVDSAIMQAQDLMERTLRQRVGTLIKSDKLEPVYLRMSTAEEKMKKESQKMEQI